MIKNVALLIILLAMVLSLVVVPSTFAQTPAHVIWGMVKDSQGNIPQLNDLHITAYITVRDTDKLYYNVAGQLSLIQYNGPDGAGAWLVQCSDFSQWAAGEVLRLEFTDDGSGESTAHEVQIDGSQEPQQDGDISLPVNLSSFVATHIDDSVSLKWTTESETNNLGFNVHRSETEDGEYIKVNQKIINGSGSVGSTRTYNYVDDSINTRVEAYFYRLEDISFTGIKNKSHPIKVNIIQVPSLSETQSIPKKFALLQSYPNPFNPETWIPYMLPVDATVTIQIYNATGCLVRTLDLGERVAGRYLAKDKAIYWDGKNEIGERVSSGVYFYAVEAGKFKAVKRMLMLK